MPLDGDVVCYAGPFHDYNCTVCGAPEAVTATEPEVAAECGPCDPEKCNCKTNTVDTPFTLNEDVFTDVGPDPEVILLRSDLALANDNALRLESRLAEGDAYIRNLENELDGEVNARLALQEELEQERTRLAGCSVAAFGYQQDLPQDAYGWSQSYQDVVDMRARHLAELGELSVGHQAEVESWVGHYSYLVHTLRSIAILGVDNSDAHRNIAVVALTALDADEPVEDQAEEQA